MKDRSKAKKRLTLNSRDIHAGWIVGAGASVVIFLLATFAIAYRHDVYSSSLGLRDLVSTDVWFRVFLALTCFSLLLFLGLLIYAFVAGRIGGSGNNEEQALPTTAITPEIKDGAETLTKEESSTLTQSASSAIDEDSLRKLLDTPFMHNQSNGSVKTNLDRVIDGLKIVKIKYKKGAKDEVYFSDKNITEIARILYKSNYLYGRNLPAFAKWNRTLFECLNIAAPDDINKTKEIGKHVEALFGFLIPKE